MADQQDLPDDGPEPAPQAPEVPTPTGDAPASDAPLPGAPTKKAPAKKAAAKKAPPKKAPVKKAPVKKAPAKKAAEAASPPPPAAPVPLAAGNGSSGLSDGAKQAAAQAKSTVEQASDSIGRPAPLVEEDDARSVFPYVVALVVGLLAVLLVRRLRQHSDDS